MYIDFKAIKAAVSIEDAANLLKLPLKKSGNQLRSNCPACGNHKNTAFDPVGIRFQAPIHRTGGAIGFYRGQVYIPIRHTDGSNSGFVGYADGQLKLPPK
jgi:hypothetical protein